MKKEEIINEISKLDIAKSEFWVLGSASLVLRNILSNANDIDLAISQRAYNILKQKYNLEYLGENNSFKWYKINDIIECCVDIKSNDKVEEFEPYNLLDLKYYYENFLKNSERKKDQEKKEIIKQKLNI